MDAKQIVFVVIIIAVVGYFIFRSIRGQVGKKHSQEEKIK